MKFQNYATKIREIAAVAQTNPARKGVKSVNVVTPARKYVNLNGMVVFV